MGGKLIDCAPQLLFFVKIQILFMNTHESDKNNNLFTIKKVSPIFTHVNYKLIPNIIMMMISDCYRIGIVKSSTHVVFIQNRSAFSVWYFCLQAV